MVVGDRASISLVHCYCCQAVKVLGLERVSGDRSLDVVWNVVVV